MLTPVLESDRLILRPLKVEDAEEAYANWTSDPDVAEYMLWQRHLSIADTIQWLTSEEDPKTLASDTNYTWGFVLKENGMLFGSGGLYLRDGGVYEIGFCIMKRYWNQGLTTEAANTMLAFAVKTLSVTSFLGRHTIDNPASGKVMEKVGFIYQHDGEYTTGTKTFKSRVYTKKIANTVDL